MSKRQLEILYQKMADLTLPECRDNCKKPYSCCSPEYCEMAIVIALEDYGLKLEPTGHATLPLMGKSGCIAPPHTRPLCTVHTCAINGMGFKAGDPDWNDEYFRLRDEIDIAESERL